MTPQRFEFQGVGRVVFGPGSLVSVAHHAMTFGRRAFVVTGATPGRAARLLGLLEEGRISHHTHPVSGEPSVSDIIAGVAEARAFRADMVIAFGGGSVIDAAKAIAGLLTNEGALEDYLEIVGKGQPLELPAAPWIAIPTTAGTGAELTRNAVLSVPERQLKVSLRSNHLFASLVLVDPELCLSVSPVVTASTGMDALTQLIEPYVCTKANPMTDAYCAAGIPRVARALPTACQSPQDLGARSELSLGALWSGIALTNAGLGAVHGFASPLGGLLGAPHGALCGVLLGPVMRANVRALRASAPDSEALRRYAEVAVWLTGRSQATPEDGAEEACRLASSLGVPRLASYGLHSGQFSQISQAALRASSMKANPVVLTEEALCACLQEAL
jgi:alcohol dehydrogenase class IV